MLPPKGAPGDFDRGRGRGRGGYDRGRGGPGGPPPPRGGAAFRGGGPPAIPRHLIPAAHIKPIGVKRPAHGTAGRMVEIVTNHFATELNQGTIYHYDGMHLSLYGKV